ncbi:unnamed protein product, partial [Meganyctiphanes norvegica]
VLPRQYSRCGKRDTCTSRYNIYSYIYIRLAFIYWTFESIVACIKLVVPKMSGSRTPQYPSEKDEEINSLLSLKIKLAKQAEETDKLLQQLQERKFSRQHNTASPVGSNISSMKHSAVSHDGLDSFELSPAGSAGNSPALRRQQSAATSHETTNSAEQSPVLRRQYLSTSATSYKPMHNISTKLPEQPGTSRQSTSIKIQQLQEKLKHISFVTNTKSKWVVTEEEQSRYNVIFNDIDEDKDGVVTGPEVKHIFMQSQLPPVTLTKIWALVDIDQSGRLIQHEFALAMWLIERAVQGIPVPDQLTTDMLPPIRSLTKSIAQTVGTVSNTWVVNATDEQIHSELFFSIDINKTGFVAGKDAKYYFDRSGLPPNVLSHIWRLCDTGQCGQLTREQFVLAMWLVEQKIKGIEVPSQLSPTMVPPSMRKNNPIASKTEIMEPSAPNYECLPPRHVLGSPPQDDDNDPTSNGPFEDNSDLTSVEKQKNVTHMKDVEATLLGVVEVKGHVDRLAPIKRATVAELCRNSLLDPGNASNTNMGGTNSNEMNELWIGRVRFCFITVTVKTNLEDKKIQLYIRNELVNEHQMLNISTMVILKDNQHQLVYMVNFGSENYGRQMAVVLSFHDHKDARALAVLFSKIKSSMHGDRSIIKINLPGPPKISSNGQRINGLRINSESSCNSKNQDICNEIGTEETQYDIAYENETQSKETEDLPGELYENELQEPNSYYNESQNLESEGSSIYEEETYENDTQDDNKYVNEGNEQHFESEEFYENTLSNSVPPIDPSSQDDLNDSDSTYEYESSQPYQEQLNPEQKINGSLTPNLPNVNTKIPPKLPPRLPPRNSTQQITDSR